MSVLEAEGQAVVSAVERLRDAVAAVRLPLQIDGAPEAAEVRQDLLHQFDDYILPRLRSLDAPLLAVIGGSTGAGKSTLVNSLVGSRVSRSGVLRPTTTSPVLVHHPDDARWFTGDRVLPGLSRVTGADVDESQPGTVRLAPLAIMAPGLALLDAPDIDSVVSANRALAGQLLQAADLWIFVTTAARYADAVPWAMLRTASERGTSVAIVLDRVDPPSMDQVRAHLAAMLAEQGLGQAPIFTIPETTLTDQGRLPAEAFAPLKTWLETLAGDARARAIVVGKTLGGVIGSLRSRVEALTVASTAQHEAANALSTAARHEFDGARAAVAESMNDGSLLRGEVLARWQEFIGTGELFKQVETTVSKWRDKLTAAITGKPTAPSSDRLDQAVQHGVATLLTAHGEAAAASIARTWRRLPGGEALLADHRDLARVSPEFRTEVDGLVRAWQGDVLELIRREGGNRRTNARVAAYGINGIGLFLMLVAFAHTGGLVGAEVGIASGTALVAQKVLEAIFGDQAVREMTRKARALLLDRAEELYAGERSRYAAAVASATVGRDQTETLLDAERTVEKVTT